MQKILANSKILVVDDFAGFRRTINTMLHSLGAKDIDQAGNATEAINRCIENSYNIIFCDYNLGDGQDGQQILEDLHQRALLMKGTLFLMVTAETTKAQVMGAIEYRPDAYLTKPFTNEQLGQRLKRLLIKNAALNKIYLAMNAGEISKAVGLCEEVMLEAPNLKFSCLRLKSELLEQLKQFQQVTALYNDVIKQQPVLWAMLGIGRIKFLEGDIEGALDHFQAIRETFPTQVSVLDWIAKCQNELGDTQNAEDTLKEAISISPKSVSRQANLGEVAASLNNHELAQKAFAKTIHEGNYSCMLKPQHFEHYYNNTREVASKLSPREKSRLMAEADQVHKKMERAYRKDPGAMATNLSAAALLYSSVGNKDKTSGILSRLNKALDDPNCKITSDQAESIGMHLQTFQQENSNEKMLNQISSRLDDIKEDIKTRKEKVVKEEDITVVAKKINAEGMLLAKQGLPLDALYKFREAIKIKPDNVNYILNASQIIIEYKELNSDPEKVNEAKRYLMDSIIIDENDIRWKRYQQLLGRVS